LRGRLFPNWREIGARRNQTFRRNHRRFLAIPAITIAALRFGVTGSARAQSNKTTPAHLRAIKVQQMEPAAIRLPII
jgi:hypothetical protein